jgi:ATP-dependent RNA helicase RhlE
LASREEESDLRAIERAVGRPLPRITIPDFDYTKRPAERFEVPLADRIAAIRAKKAEERARAKAKLERRGGAGPTSNRDGVRDGVRDGARAGGGSNGSAGGGRPYRGGGASSGGGSSAGAGSRGPPRRPPGR